MGCGISCKVFEKLPLAVQWVLMIKLNVRHTIHILDDYMFFGAQATDDCKVSLQSFLHLADSIGLPIKESKMVHPMTKAELHALQFDTEKMQISVPADKVLKAENLIHEMLGMKRVMLFMVQSLAGLLSFFTKAIPAGRSFFIAVLI